MDFISCYLLCLDHDWCLLLSFLFAPTQMAAARLQLAGQNSWFPSLVSITVAPIFCDVLVQQLSTSIFLYSIHGVFHVAGGRRAAP
jgi:hypothetical protein